jgi:putative ABC transport system ATP-binding protein
MRLLAELRDSGITIVFVTHEADIAAFAARKLVLRDGIIVNDIRQQPEAAHPAHALPGGTHDPGH